MTPVRVLVVDDQEPFRQVAVAVVEATAEFVVAGTAASAEESLRKVSATPVDLVLMDVHLPGMDGIEAARVLAGMPDAPFVVLLSTDDDEEILERVAATGGGTAFLPKERFGSEPLVRLWERRPRRPGLPSRTPCGVPPGAG